MAQQAARLQESAAAAIAEAKASMELRVANVVRDADRRVAAANS